MVPGECFERECARVELWFGRRRRALSVWVCNINKEGLKG